MIAAEVAVESRGALNRSGRALIERNALGERSRGDETVEVAFGRLQTIDVSDEFRSATPRARRQAICREQDRGAGRRARECFEGNGFPSVARSIAWPVLRAACPEPRRPSASWCCKDGRGNAGGCIGVQAPRAVREALAREPAHRSRRRVLPPRNKRAHERRVPTPETRSAMTTA